MTQTGDVHRVKTWDHNTPNARFTYSANNGRRGKKNQRVVLMLLLGDEPADGSAPLDPEKCLNQLGWYYRKPRASRGKRKTEGPSEVPKSDV